MTRLLPIRSRPEARIAVRLRANGVAARRSQGGIIGCTVAYDLGHDLHHPAAYRVRTDASAIHDGGAIHCGDPCRKFVADRGRAQPLQIRRKSQFWRQGGPIRLRGCFQDDGGRSRGRNPRGRRVRLACCGMGGTHQTTHQQEEDDQRSHVEARRYRIKSVHPVSRLRSADRNEPIHASHRTKRRARHTRCRLFFAHLTNF